MKSEVPASRPRLSAEARATDATGFKPQPEIRPLRRSNRKWKKGMNTKVHSILPLAGLAMADLGTATATAQEGVRP